ncbi:MAG: cobamide remodeling phosphodiesterase CbiR [Desulfomonilaceae bacterium]
MRLGTTSYIYPADIITNVRKLAGQTQDIELVFFEIDDRWNSLPTDSEINELKEIASNFDMTYTVHLPLNVYLSDHHPFIEKTIKVIESTLPLNPFAYICHLESSELAASTHISIWERQSINSLEILIDVIGDPSKLCVENLETQAPSLLDHITDNLPVSYCIDIGHFWKKGLDPMPYMQRWFPRVRVIHMHGFEGSDHKSLSVVNFVKLDPIVEIINKHFRGVVTLEVFSEKDFLESVESFWNSLERIMRQTAIARRISVGPTLKKGKS